MILLSIYGKEEDSLEVFDYDEVTFFDLACIFNTSYEEFVREFVKNDYFGNEIGFVCYR